jgi:hypothetical protein
MQHLAGVAMISYITEFTSRWYPENRGQLRGEYERALRARTLIPTRIQEVVEEAVEAGIEVDEAEAQVKQANETTTAAEGQKQERACPDPLLRVFKMKTTAHRKKTPRGFVLYAYSLAEVISLAFGPSPKAPLRPRSNVPESTTNDQLPLPLLLPPTPNTTTHQDSKSR